MLNEQDLLRSSEDEYMSDEQLSFFKAKLVEKAAFITQRLNGNNDSLSVQRSADANDAASGEEALTLKLSMDIKDRATLRQVKKALQLIEDGEYGFCLETGEPIGLKRLLLIPESIYTVETMRVIEAKMGHVRAA